ncbi:MAG: 30S ribosomal protein S20 [Planctomycetota bacterium]|jgi:small subunit ribosomal protein S20
MPNSKQALKRLVTDEKRRLHNKTIRTSMRSAMKGVLSASDKEAGKEALSEATKRIDKAAKRHIIHANAAARYKSRLAQRVNQLG